MDMEIIEKYKQEMLKMKQRAVMSDNVAVPSKPSTIQHNLLGENGGIIGEVTVIRGLYPVSNAKFTVYTSDGEDITIIGEDFTDQSGKTKLFTLKTPPKNLSLDESNTQPTYALYNVKITADGYVDNIHLNIPVFSGVVSSVKSNLTALGTAGDNKGPIIYNELPDFKL